MCGRYQFTAEQSAEILRIIREVELRCGHGHWHPGEIYPSAKAPVLLNSAGETTADLMRWGYKFPSGLVINARAETAMEKPLFRDSVIYRRCVIPSTGFFEWDVTKRKYLFTLPGEKLLYMAGLYNKRDGENCYCILTTAANESMRPIHDRMPLVLTTDQYQEWLEDNDASASILTMIPPILECADVTPQMRLW